MKTHFILTTILLSSVLAGCEEEAQVSGEVRPVRAILAERQVVTEQRTAVGEVLPRRQSTLSFQVSGKVIERRVNVGDVVKPGDIIARLDPQDYQKRLAAAEADVRAAEASCAEAQATEVRQRKLLDKGIIAKAGYDNALSTRKTAEAALESARIAHSMAADQLSYTELKAEASGIVTAASVEAEHVVSPGQTIVQLANDDEVDAVFSVAESSIIDGFFGIGSLITVTLLSDPHSAAVGRVREVAPMADAATRTFEVKVALARLPKALMFGASVNGEATMSRSSGFTLPGSAIFDRKGETAVWIYDRSSASVSLKPVEISQFDVDSAIVSRGINRGDLVVTAGVNQLRQGEKVKLLQE